MEYICLATLNAAGLADVRKRKYIDTQLLIKNIILCGLQETNFKVIPADIIHGTFYGFPTNVLHAGLAIWVDKRCVVIHETVEIVHNRVQELSCTINGIHTVIYNVHLPHQAAELDATLQVWADRLRMWNVKIPFLHGKPHHSFYNASGEVQVVPNKPILLNKAYFMVNKIEPEFITIGDFNLQLAKPAENKLWAKPKLRSWLLSLVTAMGSALLPMSMNSTTLNGTRGASVLDYICIPRSWVLRVKDFSVTTFYRTDHTLVSAHIYITNHSWAKPPYWRFRNVLLANDCFVASMTDFMTEKLASTSQDSSIVVFWEDFKLQCITFARKFWAQNKDRLNSQGSAEHKYKGPPAEILFLKDHVSNCIVNDKQSISENLINFYKDLYTPGLFTTAPPKNMTFGLPRIPPDLVENLSQELQLAELEAALSTMKTDRAPGCDGLTMEFYAKFWPLLGPVILRWAIQIFANGQLSGSAAVGVITLIPKKGDLREISNWRPITLITVDTKIVLKALANRLKPAIEIVIPEYQNVVPGRSISHSLASIRDTISLHKLKKKPLYVLSLDQRKAFDRVNHNFLFHLLSVIGLPESFVMAIKAFYSGFTCCIKNVSYLTSTFPYSRGVRQGDPLATLLYALALQPALNAISIVGQLGSTEIIAPAFITAYADDVTVFLSHPETVKNIVEIFQEVAKYSEAELNLDKSALASFFTPVNCILNDKNIFYGIPISRGSVTVLGITFNHKEKICSAQWENMLLSTREEIAKEVGFLKDRTYHERSRWVTVKLWPRWAYLLKVLQPSNLQVSNLMTVLAEAVWLGAKHWLPPNILSTPVANGGLNMLSVATKLNMFRIKFLVQCLKDGAKSINFQLAECILNYYNKASLGFNILHTKPNKLHIQGLPPFYQAAYEAWNKLPTAFSPMTKEQFITLPCFDAKPLQDASPMFGLSSAQASSYGTYTISEFMNFTPRIITRVFESLYTSIQSIVEKWHPPELPRCTCNNNDGSQNDRSIRQTDNVGIPSFFMVSGDDYVHICAWKNKFVYNVLIACDVIENEHQDAGKAWRAINSSIAPSVLINRYWRFGHRKVADSRFFYNTGLIPNPICVLFNISSKCVLH